MLLISSANMAFGYSKQKLPEEHQNDRNFEKQIKWQKYKVNGLSYHLQSPQKTSTWRNLLHLERRISAINQPKPWCLIKPITTATIANTVQETLNPFWINSNFLRRQDARLPRILIWNLKVCTGKLRLRTHPTPGCLVVTFTQANMKSRSCHAMDGGSLKSWGHDSAY